MATIKSTCWFSEHEVKFKLETGIYQNIIDFLIINNISFLAEMKLDFTTIPINLHGKGNSRNLLDYISKNSENVVLIKSFLEYFMIQIAKIKYNDKLIIFYFNLIDSWDNMQLSIFDPFIPTTTTTTTLFPIIRKGPYIIYNDINTEMTIHWQNLETSTDNISWGTTTGYTNGSIINSEYGDDHQHKYTITGLTNNTKYYYKIDINGINHFGTFYSAPNNLTTSVKFIAYGDTRTNYSTHNALAAQITSDEDYNSLIISMGDLVEYGYEDSVGGVWDTEFFNQNMTNIKYMLANSPYMSAIGNHDIGEPFRKYFQYPFENDIVLDPFATNAYYTYNYGPIQFFVIDDYVDYDSGSTQYNWFVSELSASTKTWKIVYFHRPGWSANGSQENDPIIQNVYEPLFEQYNVKIVFVGHNHYYARALVNNYGNDVYHITTGGGGAPLRVIDLNYPNVITGFTAYHYCKVDIEDYSMNVDVIDINGNLIDHFSINQYITTTITPTTTLEPMFELFGQLYSI